MRRLFLTALALTILLRLLAVMLVFLAAAGESAAQCGTSLAATGPVGGVPAAEIPLFEGAAGRFALGARGPSILAGINYVESTFDQSNQPGVHSGANYAGAMGPMQFQQGTWDTYKVQAPGGAVPPNVYDEADAVYSAANYLNASGAPGDWASAIFAYNQRPRSSSPRHLRSPRGSPARRRPSGRGFRASASSCCTSAKRRRPRSSASTAP